MHIKSVIRYTALIQLLLACFLVIPTFIAFINNETLAFEAFVFTIFLIIAVCALALILTKDEKANIKPKDSYLLVTLTWIVATAFTCIPLYLTKTMPTYLQCYFEIMSGFTTTGATALVTIEDKFRSILFWRNMTNWLGGMGIVVLFVAILPMLGVKGTNLVSAESVGPTKDKLTPKIQQTAYSLWLIYVGLTIIQVVLLLLGGLAPFDAFTITFGTMGAAGFTARNTSIASYNSAYVDAICTIFMILTSLNYALFFKLLRRQVKQVIKDGELRFYLAVVSFITLFISINLFAKGIYNSFSTSFRYAVFQVASLISTTGFATADYTQWPAFSRMLLMLLFFVGGCAGSTGGGIKAVRVYVLMHMSKNTITKRLHPTSISPLTISGSVVAPETILSIAGFFAAYLATGLIGAVIFSTSGESFETCFSAAFLLLGNIGIGFDNIGPLGTFAIFNDAVLTAGSFLMLVGRLELFTVYALFTKRFWRD